MLNTFTNFALCGPVREQGEADDSINRLATRAGCEHFLFKTLVNLVLALIVRNIQY